MALWGFLLVARANSIEMPEQTGFGDPAEVRAAVRRTERGATTRGRSSALGAHSRRAAELRARRVRRDADSVMVDYVVRPCITCISAIWCAAQFGRAYRERGSPFAAFTSIASVFSQPAVLASLQPRSMFSQVQQASNVVAYAGNLISGCST